MTRITYKRVAVPTLLAACALFTGSAAAMDADAADKNDKKLDNVPAKVKETLLKESQGREIREVDRDTIDGRVVYRAKLQRDGKDLKLTLDEKGNVIGRNDGDVHDEKVAGTDGDRDLKDKDRDGKNVDAKAMTIDALPAKAKAALKKEAGAHEIVDIDRSTDDGRTVYKARIKQDGLDRRVSVDEDGNVVSGANRKDHDGDDRGAKVDRDARSDSNAKDEGKDFDRQAKDAKKDSDRDVEHAKAKAERDVDLAKAKSERDLDKSKAEAEAKAEKAKADAEFAKKTAKDDGKDAKREAKNGTVTMDQLPAAVKAAFMKEANGQQIGDIDRDTEDGRVVYKAKVRVPDGKDRKIKILADGSVVSKKD
ncbi:MAG: PepSY-like domain-containing protein [Planctomycetes bacterium]|nr:PepSY-like domain-containing protein [Planctomycetota bacterium]